MAVGMIGLPCVQLVEMSLYDKLHGTTVTFAMVGLNRAAAACLPFIGAGLGAWSAALCSYRLSRDDAGIRSCADSTIIPIGMTFTLIALSFFHNFSYGWPLRTYVPMLFCNAPLQWAVALAILGRVAVGKLEREERRALKDTAREPPATRPSDGTSP